MTGQEIVQALRQCAKSDCSSCGMCPIFPDRECVEHLVTAAASLIERLTAENAALREGASLGKAKRQQKKAYEKSIEFLRALTDGQSDEIKSLRRELEGNDMVIAIAQKEQAKAEAERDALREKVPQWISVEDRLPADYIKRYLIAFKDAGGSIVDAARYIPGLGWECRNWEVPQGLITDWMPLPGAPEKGDKA